MRTEKLGGRGHNIKRRPRYGMKSLFQLITILVITVSIVAGGTYAWKNSDASTTSKEFKMATVKLEYNSPKNTSLLVFKSDKDSAKAQKEFEKELSSLKSDTEKNKFMAKWLQTNNKAGSDKHLIEPSGKFGGGFAITEYTFKNSSNTPVYFRIKSTGIKQESKDTGCPEAALIMIGDDWVEMDKSGEYYYYTQPLDEGIKSITVKFAAYIENGSNHGGYSAGVEYAEIIQASNNAVHLSDDWSDLSALLKEIS